MGTRSFKVSTPLFNDRQNRIIDADSHYKTDQISWTCFTEGVLQNLILTGKVEGQRARGRQRL